jgi:hypothetical protein
MIAENKYVNLHLNSHGKLSEQAKQPHEYKTQSGIDFPSGI